MTDLAVVSTDIALLGTIEEIAKLPAESQPAYITAALAESRKWLHLATEATNPRHLWRKPRAVKASRSRDATSSDGPPRRRRNSGTGVEPDRHSGLPRSRT